MPSKENYSSWKPRHGYIAVGTGIAALSFLTFISNDEDPSHAEILKDTVQVAPAAPPVSTQVSRHSSPTQQAPATPHLDSDPEPFHDAGNEIASSYQRHLREPGHEHERSSYVPPKGAILDPSKPEDKEYQEALRQYYLHQREAAHSKTDDGAEDEPDGHATPPRPYSIPKGAN